MTTSALPLSSMIPVAILSTLVLSVAAVSRGTQMRTYRAEVHIAGERDDPEVPIIKNIVTIELREELALDRWVSERRIKQRTDQKAIG